MYHLTQRDHAEQPTSDHSAAFNDLAPFAAIAVAGWIAVLIGNSINWVEYGISLAVLGCAWTFGLVPGFRGQVRSGTVIGSILFVVALGIMRQSASDKVVGMSCLAMLPVLHTALNVRGRGSLHLVLASLPVFYLVPLILYPAQQGGAQAYAPAMLAIAVSWIIGLVTQSLVTDIRHRVREAHQREQMLVRVNGVVQDLLESPHTRTDICTAIREISDATMAVLIEPVRGTDILRFTAASGVDDRELSARSISPGSPAYSVFRSREPLFVNDHIKDAIATDRPTDEAPRTMLHKPLVKSDSIIGVLVAGWSEVLREDDPRVSVARLLARQMATVIGHADVIDQLAGEALSDPLTGLPNRRAWDLRMRQSLAGGQRLAVVKLEIDHLKLYSDAHGHPTADTLLQRAAAAWQQEVRAGDFLARLGGEEFGVLLPGTDLSTAERIVERLRGRMPAPETCSAGIAMRLAGDDSEKLVGRADRALDEAKASGRNRTIVVTEDGSRTVGAQVLVGRLGDA
jgi:diguanylate cyclase (GGDEF)-like protein